jgi:TolB-like protein/tetratricopeptide (TPR) repeat protein
VSVDVFGFPRETDDDRNKIALAFEALTARLEATAARHFGHVFSGAADGFFLELPSAEAAVTAGDEIANGPWPPVRVGVHEGPVEALPSGELAGKTVQVAARIQQAADKGAVLVSEDVRKDLHSGPLAKRLHRDTAQVKFDRPEDNTPVYKLSYVQIVDESALRARNRQIALRVGAGVVVVAAFVGIVFGRDIYTTLFPRYDHVAIQQLKALGTDKDASEFADGLTDEIGYSLGQNQIPTVVGKIAESLRGSDRGGQARRYQVGAVLDGTVSGDASNLDINLKINDPVHHKTLWSHEFRGSGDYFQSQISSRVVSVLTCSAQAMQPGAHISDPDAIALYVKFCDLNADAASDPNALADGEKALRDLTAKAPQFSYGHSNLALFLYSKASVDPANASALVAESGREADRAIALDPKNPDGYAARARLAPPQDWIGQEKFLAKAVAQPGAGPVPNDIYALMLGQVGRLSDAAVYAQKVASEDSGDPDYVSLIATSLATQGKDDAADSALTRALEIAPNNALNQAFRFHMYEWFGRWDEAQRILADDANRSPLLTQEEDLAAAQAFDQAMATQEPGAIAAARQAEFASVSHDRAHLMIAISHLSALGQVDDAFRLADQFPPSADKDDTSVLFTPLNANLRRDPRFIPLAAKLGLVSYWTRSGKWPDFCAARDLPYSCLAEVRKLGSK